MKLKIYNTHINKLWLSVLYSHLSFLTTTNSYMLYLTGNNNDDMSRIQDGYWLARKDVNQMFGLFRVIILSS